MTVASNLRHLRKRMCLTQIEMAKKIGVSIATLRRYESGEHMPNAVMLKTIADILACTLKDILGDEKPIVKDEVHKESEILSSCENNGRLLFEGNLNGNNVKIEVPATKEGYELFQDLLHRVGLI